MHVLPTGEQFVLRRAGAEATVVEVGGGLRTYRAGGRDLLDGYRDDEPAEDARGHVLAPWPNRLRDGRYVWDGREHRTPLTEPERGTALHGLVRFVAWRPVERSDSAVTLEHLLHPQPGYPFALRLRVAYALTSDGLQVRTTATNAGREPLPYGEGHHPYLAVAPGARVDDCTFAVSAATRLETDDRGLPTGDVPVAGTPYDFRTARPIGDLRLDAAFTSLDRDDQGRAWARLTWPDGRGVALWADEAYRHLQLFTADEPVAPARRRRGLAVEPMTCPPDALRTGRDVLRLEPGEQTTATWGLQPIG